MAIILSIMYGFEGAEVFASHFNHLYGRTPSYDPTVLELLDQDPVFPDIDGLPTDDEIAKGISGCMQQAPGPLEHMRSFGKLLPRPPQASTTSDTL